MIDAPLDVFDFEQNSPEWIAARLGVPTASAFADVLAKGEGKTRGKYLRVLAGEILTGEPNPDRYENDNMKRGHAMEDDARAMYAFQFDADPVPVGFMRRGRVGASPDRLIGDDGLLEVKTKFPHLLLDVLERDRLPPEHVAQVQGQLWVSGREWCDFIAYWPKMPLFRIRVYRDEDYITNLAAQVKTFIADLDALVSKWGDA